MFDMNPSRPAIKTANLSTSSPQAATDPFYRNTPKANAYSPISPRTILADHGNAMNPLPPTSFSPVSTGTSGTVRSEITLINDTMAELDLSNRCPRLYASHLSQQSSTTDTSNYYTSTNNSSADASELKIITAVGSKAVSCSSASSSPWHPSPTGSESQYQHTARTRHFNFEKAIDLSSHPSAVGPGSRLSNATNGDRNTDPSTRDHRSATFQHDVVCADLSGPTETTPSGALTSPLPTTPRHPINSPHPTQHQTPQHHYQSSKRIVDNFRLGKTLGAGSMGKVKLAVDILTGEKVAAKIIPRSKTVKDIASDVSSGKEDNKEVRILREASIMMLLHHPYIVGLRKVMVASEHYYMFLEYVNGGQMLDYIISHGKLKEKHARKFSRQILSAIDYCHCNSIVHRDLKIENILISKTGTIKIIDFGLANLYSKSSQLSTFCGSLYFAAPELLSAKVYIGPEVDVWSMGIVLYVLVCGKVPFDDQSMPALHAKIKRGIVEYPNWISPECKHLLSRMLVVNPAQRATVAELLQHPWVNKGYETIPDSYLPLRAPLTMPLDMEVVRNMTGFELGDPEDILSRLETVVSGVKYQSLAAAQFKNQLMRMKSRRKSSAPFVEDPTAGLQSPLISIYYLVRERMERERSMGLEPLKPMTPAILPGCEKRPTSSPSQRPSALFGFETPAAPTYDLMPAHRKSVCSGHRAITQTSDTRSAQKSQAGTSITLGPELQTQHLGSPCSSALLEVGFEARHDVFENRHHDSKHTPSHADASSKKARSLFRRLSLAITNTSAWGTIRRNSRGDGPVINISETGDAESMRLNSSNQERQSRALWPRRHSECPTPTSPAALHSASPVLSSKSAISINRRRLSATPIYSKELPSLPSDQQQDSIQPSSFLALPGDVTFSKQRRRSAMSLRPHIVRPRRSMSSATTAPNSPHIQSAVAAALTSQSFSGSVKTSPIPKAIDSPRPTHPDTLLPRQASVSSRRSSLFNVLGTADTRIKTVSLRGLFSVATTSTRSPSFIRMDMLRVMSILEIWFKETASCFECNFQTLSGREETKVTPKPSPCLKGQLEPQDRYNYQNHDYDPQDWQVNRRSFLENSSDDVKSTSSNSFNILSRRRSSTISSKAAAVINNKILHRSNFSNHSTCNPANLAETAPPAATKTRSSASFSSTATVTSLSEPPINSLANTLHHFERLALPVSPSTLLLPPPPPSYHPSYHSGPHPSRPGGHLTGSGECVKKIAPGSHSAPSSYPVSLAATPTASPATPYATPSMTTPPPTLELTATKKNTAATAVAGPDLITLEDRGGNDDDEVLCEAEDSNNRCREDKQDERERHPVRFEISIVKVKFVPGLFGIQFRRIGGDFLLYKRMCSKILAELRI